MQMDFEPKVSGLALVRPFEGINPELFSITSSACNSVQEEVLGSECNEADVMPIGLRSYS